MGPHPPPDDPPLLAVAALDDFVAEIVRQAHARGMVLPPRFFDWSTDEGTRLVERLVRRRRVHAPAPGRAGELATALRCGVRYWIAPWVVVRFPELGVLFPELSLQSRGDEVSVLVRTGRWRCSSAADCAWKLCDG
jgi:hypothetical protein